MTYRDEQRLHDILHDILAAIDAIGAHTARGDLSDGLIFDAVRIRLLEIGEAVKALPMALLDSEPSIPWSQIAGMRDHLAHRYFDTPPMPSSRPPSTTTSPHSEQPSNDFSATCHPIPADGSATSLRPGDSTAGAFTGTRAERSRDERPSACQFALNAACA